MTDTPLAPDATPRLAPGCRLHPTEAVLLIPEGALQLTGPSRDILFRLDGRKTVETIIDELLLQYPAAERAEVGADVIELLTRLQQRGVVRV